MARITCNLERPGRWLRGVSGFVVLILAALLYFTDWVPMAPGWRLLTAVLLLLFGGFQLFEAFVGWCAVRALGFRTPI